MIWTIASCLAACSTGSSVQASTSFNVAIVQGSPDASVNVPITIRGTTNLVAAQFDLTYDPSRADAGVTTLATGLSGHSIVSRMVSPGVTRVIVYSVSNASLGENGGICDASFRLAATAKTGSGPIRPAAVLAANSHATIEPSIALNPGRIFVTPISVDAETKQTTLFLPTQSDKRYALQASTNLVDWVMISTNQAWSGFLEIVDSDAQRYPQRYYRLAWLDALISGWIDEIAVQPDHNTRLRLTGLIDRSYALLASTNLIDWISVATNASANGIIDWIDHDASRFTYRFYRPVLLQGPVGGRIDAINIQGNGAIRFRLTKAIGLRHVLQASGDLAHWTNVQTNSTAGESIEFAIAIDKTLPMRFLRIRSE